ncbi:uncharacterized protein LOC143026272 [Oratosquilla oratoria]|uniref:uncharacterized protein LOC143026272 n=1 Tax=Oratosquilla oratoria TaxID=337810 RepID=UPI003F76A080
MIRVLICASAVFLLGLTQGKPHHHHLNITPGNSTHASDGRHYSDHFHGVRGHIASVAARCPHSTKHAEHIKELLQHNFEAHNETHAHDGHTHEHHAHIYFQNPDPFNTECHIHK